MRVLSSVAIIFIGCATSAKYQVSDQNSAERPSFSVVDNRTKDQKEAKVMSLSISNCWYGIYRIGDKQIEPNRIDLIAGELQKKFKEAGIKTLTINRFEIYNNIQEGLRRTALASSFGLVGLALRDHIKAGGCTDGFALDENPKNEAAVIILLELDVDGKKVTEKVVQIDPKGTGNESVRSPVIEERVERGLKKAIEKAMDNLSSQMHL